VGILEAVGSLFTKAAGAVTGVAEAAWSGVKALYTFATSIFDKVSDGWNWMVNGLGWIGSNLLGWAAVVYNLLKWAVEKGIPGAAEWAYNHSVVWATNELKKARKWAEHTIAAVRKWLEGLWSDLKRYTIGAIKDVWDTLAQAWNWIEKSGKAAVSLIEHPEHLAEILVEHIAWPLLLWLTRRSATFMLWLGRTLIANTAELASILEDALDKII
jgi:hypothetical protein